MPKYAFLTNLVKVRDILLSMSLRTFSWSFFAKPDDQNRLGISHDGPDEKKEGRRISPPPRCRPRRSVSTYDYWLSGFRAWHAATPATAAPAGSTRTTASSYEQKLRLPV